MSFGSIMGRFLTFIYELLITCKFVLVFVTFYDVLEWAAMNKKR